MLVHRHLPLVYSAALRQVGGDAHRAHDVAQTVFTTLARKAHALHEHPVLTAWLYKTTLYAAAKMRRGEQRRRLREREVQAMQESLNDPTGDWEQLRHVIDAAMLQLTERDRVAVLLRFFENRPFAEIGARLGLSENSARMRVERALGALHAALVKRGITSTSAALGIALANQAISAAPMGLTASISSSAFAAAVGTGTALFMSSTTIKIGLAAIVIAAGTTGLIVQYRSNTELSTEIASLRPEAQATAHLRAENARLVSEMAAQSDEHAELLNLRNEVAGLSQKLIQRTVPKPIANANTWSTESTASAPILILQNQGIASPALGVETMYWAIHNSDSDAFARTLYLGAARAEVQAAFDSLPQATQQELGIPEKMIAEAFLADSSSLKQITGLQVLGIGQENDGQVALRVNIQEPSGTIRESIYILHHSDAGWQVPLAPSTVKQYLSRFLQARQ